MNPHFMTPVESLPIDLLLPSSSDKQSMLHNFTVMIARVLVEEFSYFKNAFGYIVPNHIAHIYSEEMRTTSEVVSELNYMYCLSYYA